MVMFGPMICDLYQR